MNRMNRIYGILGGAAVASVLALSPLAASAASLSGSAHAGTGVFINPSGIVRVIGADVSAVSNGVITAAAQLGNVVLNFVINTSTSTKIRAGASGSASSSAIAVGDKVSFVGSLSSSTGSAFTVAATKIRDLTNFIPRHIASSTKERGDNDNDGDKKDDANVSASTTMNVDTAKHGGFHFFGGLHLGVDD